MIVAYLSGPLENVIGVYDVAGRTVTMQTLSGDVLTTLTAADENWSGALDGTPDYVRSLWIVPGTYTGD